MAKKMNKERFLRTEFGSALQECTTAWDKWLEIGDREAAYWCQAQWEVYQMALRQFYGIEYHFTRTNEYFGVVMANEDWLFKIERKISVQKNNTKKSIISTFVKRKAIKMNELKVFENKEFGSIRTVEVNGEPYFVGKDVAEILGYTNTPKAIRDHVDEEDKLTERIVLSGQNREMICINESGLYALIFGSKLESAKRFKHWVTSEVLPSIRKTGTYGIQPQGKELLALAVLEAQKIIEEQNQQIEEMKPKAQFADAITACDTSILIRDLAKLLRQNKVPTGEKRLYGWMRQNGYIVKGTTQPTQRAMELGLFEVIERSIVRGDHLPQVKMTTKVTTKGQCYFINKILAESKKVNNG